MAKYTHNSIDVVVLQVTLCYRIKESLLTKILPTKNV
jgi:hypothetical protein